jgi:hypothetical protein
VSIGVSYDHRVAPPGNDYKEKFWNVIRRYPIFDRVLFEENVIEFHFFKNCQHLTDTFVSARRYGMAGDAASVIDAYYSQGMSLALVTSWHICNIMEQDLREGFLDVEYIERVNRHTTEDWLMMRNIVKEKYTEAMTDSRFFILSHLLDMVSFVNIALPRFQLVRWLVGTGGQPENEEVLHREIRKNLSKKLYYTRRAFLSPAMVRRLQGYMQRKLGERARWRHEHSVKLPDLRCIIRTPGGLLKLWKLPFSGTQRFLDISPSYLAEPPKWMCLTGEENSPFLLKVAGPAMTIIFLVMYFYDWAATMLTKFKVALNLKRRRISTSTSVVMPSTLPAEKSGGD